MNIRFIIPGKNRSDSLSDLYADYLKRISKYAKVTLQYIKEETPKSDSQKDILIALDNEAAVVFKSLKKDDFLILSDIHSSMLDSKNFASQMEKISLTNTNLVFYIGSSNGISDRLRERANFSFSLSKLTFTHYHALLLVLEQVYRSFLIRNNKPYDK